MHAIFNQLITKVRESIKGRPKTNKQTKKHYLKISIRIEADFLFKNHESKDKQVTTSKSSKMSTNMIYFNPSTLKVEY